jgi:hypothetical protein
MVRADIGFKACRYQRAHRREHRLAAVHRHRARRRCFLAWTRRGRRRQGRRLRLHLCRGLRLPCRWQSHRRTQNSQNYSFCSFLHSSCRSSRSDQRLFLTLQRFSTRAGMSAR